MKAANKQYRASRCTTPVEDLVESMVQEIFRQPQFEEVLRYPPPSSFRALRNLGCAGDYRW